MPDGIVIVGLPGVLVAYRQWRTGHENLRLALFERRAEVYDAAHTLIVVALSKNVREQDLAAYNKGVKHARWLFDDDIYYYIDEEIYGKAIDLQTIQIERAEPGADNVISETASRNRDLEKHFSLQFSELHRRFRPFWT